MMYASDHITSSRQRGAVALMAAVFLILVVVILGMVAMRLAATSVNDSLLNHDAARSLFLAETAIERAAGQLASGAVTCGPGLAGNWTLAGDNLRVDNIGADFNRDFAGTALPADQCRVRGTGIAGLFAAQRSIEAIIEIGDGNILGSANADFNNPPGSCVAPGCTPTGWTLPPGGWDDTGGPDGSRAAYVEKPNPGGSTSTTAGQFSMTPFTVNRPTTLTLDFDYRLDTGGGGGQRMELTFRVYAGATVYTANGAPFQTSHTGAFQNGTVTFTIGGSGPLTIDGFGFDMVARSGQPKYGWVDNLVLTDNAGGGGGTATIGQWRERIQ